MKAIWVSAIGWLLWMSSHVQAEMRVECVQGCLFTSANQSVNLLLRSADSDAVTIRWTSTDNPQADGSIVTLYADNPVRQAEAISQRGKLIFTATGEGDWEATRQFSGAELGGGTFLAVVTQRPKDSTWEPSGSNEVILHWRAFRLLTAKSLKEKQAKVSPGSAWGVVVEPWLVRATSGTRFLPPAQGQDKPVWWSIADMEGDTSDLDLDGEASGIPGLSIQRSTVWHTTKDQHNWIDALKERLPKLMGHQIRFEDLKPTPSKPQGFSVDLKSEKLDLHYYYTVITLFTNATVKSFDDKEVGANHLFISPTYYSHETSARLEHTEDPRFWASYSQREYSADKRLLGILGRHVKRWGTVPGLSVIHQDDGDGGDVSYTAGFYANVRPLEIPTDDGKAKRRAGFVGIDVVAARFGIGGPITEGSGAHTDLKRVWCNTIGCDKSAGSLDLDRPPDGYQVAQPLAELKTPEGELPMIAIDDDPYVAQRSNLDEARISQKAQLLSLPTEVRFAVSAKLRAGALIQQNNRFLYGGHIENIVPINTYAQFVVKLTVAVDQKEIIQTSEEAIVPSPLSLRSIITVPENQSHGFWSWVTSHSLITSAVLMSGLALLTWFVPGALPLVASVARLVTQMLQFLVDIVAFLFRKLANLIKSDSNK